MADSALLVSHRGRTKQFFFSEATRPEYLELMLRKAFRLQERLQGVISARGTKVSFKYLMRHVQRTGEHEFTLQLQQPEQEEQQPAGIHQSSMSKESGRRTPPRESELPKERYFIDDFQLFVQEVGNEHQSKLFGIVFFENLKDAQFLGKKILRELVYEYGSTIEFFYSIYPSKIHTGSMLLGPALVFSLFRGRTMLLERIFPRALNAIQEISYLVKTLMSSGELDRKIEQAEREHLKKHSNSRRMQIDTVEDQDDAQAKVIVKRPSYLTVQPQVEQSLERSLPVTPEKDPIAAKNKLLANSPILPLRKASEHLESNVMPNSSQQADPAANKAPQLNEISFEDHHELRFPDWFSEGDTLEPCEKGVIVNLINNNDEAFLKFCQGLNLASPSKRQLSAQLVKVFCKDKVESIVKQFSQRERQYVEAHRKNRASVVFSQLLRFQKLGNIPQFVAALKKHLEGVFKAPDLSYTQIARQISDEANVFKIKLFSDDRKDDDKKMRDTLLAKNPSIEDQIRQMTNTFHYSDTSFVLNAQDSMRYKVLLSRDFSAPEIERIMQLLKVGDPFIIKELDASSLTQEAVARLRKLIRNKKYEGELLDELESPSLRPIRKKIEKFGNFKSLISYLYEFKRINKKQLKLFSYLYVWEDINVLGAFEAYYANHNLEEFIETIYIIDQIYFTRNKYGLELNEIEKFNDILEHQLEILFTHKEEISLEDRLALEKLVRAGDTTIMKMYKESKGEKKALFLKNLRGYAAAKRVELEELENNRRSKDDSRLAKKKEWETFLRQIIPVHIIKKVQFNPELVYECLDKNEPILLAIFELYEVTSDLVDWIENFKMYVGRLPKIHCRVIMESVLETMNCSDLEKLTMTKLIQGNSSLVQGVYQVYLLTKDKEELEDSLRRILKIK